MVIIVWLKAIVPKLEINLNSIYLELVVREKCKYEFNAKNIFVGKFVLIEPS